VLALGFVRGQRSNFWKRCERKRSTPTGLMSTTEPVANPTFWLTVRQALLLLVDAIETLLEISPRTSELRRLARRG